jgi:RNA polymerase sigma-70 factor (ECF subfamily)
MMLQVLLAVTGVVPCGAIRAQEITLDSAPPVVVRTVPEAGADGVDPATAEVRVTFSKPMTDRSWSWAQANAESFPELAGEPRYEKDRRTCVLPVKLQPGRTYAIWINSPRHGNFKDAAGTSALPYLLVFRTKP